MNPLTLVKRIQKINSTEASLGISEEGSWHAKYKDSAYVFAGGIPFDLTEGDLVAVFAQYGEVVDVNLVRDKGTGKSRGFAFIAYEDQRSTILAVDNLNGAKLLDRIIRVDHVSNYKRKEQEEEEEDNHKRESRGVCYAYQRGECNRGAACKFSHDEQRNANTGWGPKSDISSRWGHDKYDDPRKSHKRFVNNSSEQALQYGRKDGQSESSKSMYDGGYSSRPEADAEKKHSDNHHGKHRERSSKKDHDQNKYGRDSEMQKAVENKKDDRHLQKHPEKMKFERFHEDDSNMRAYEKRRRHHDKSSGSRSLVEEDGKGRKRDEYGAQGYDKESRQDKGHPSSRYTGEDDEDIRRRSKRQ